MSKRTADTLRLLAADMVEKAQSGHPGLPMGMADCAAVLWTKFLRLNPADPDWPGRDRFVMSGGHGSALLYGLLHLAGYGITLDDLKAFRQWGSVTPGHPEREIPGVETTTGPLGQGLANAVGMAMAAGMAAARWNDETFSLFGDHYIYCFCGDGDLMEGVSHEASSLAGHLGLDRLICFYDNNGITIDGNTGLTFSENVAMRYRAYGWQVMEIDGHDQEQIERAILEAQKEKEKPSLIVAWTHIAFGSPNRQDTPEAHGSPLGEEELRLTKEKLGFPPDRSFYIPEEAKKEFAGHAGKVKPEYDAWQMRYREWQEKRPEAYRAYVGQASKIFPEDLRENILTGLKNKDNSTRAHSGNILQTLEKNIPGLIGGSADLAGSNKTTLKQGGDLSRGDFKGRNIHFGIREFAMGALMNGIALYGCGFIPFGGTFLVFSDYMRSAIRMAALMKIQVIYVFTHDSIFVGEDGPTHQPVEQLMSLRLIPGLTVIRPADERETMESWISALENREGPTAIVLTRQTCPEQPRERSDRIQHFNRGAYIVKDTPGTPDMILAGSGSELSLCTEAAGMLASEGCAVRVVSVPAYETFLLQDEPYRESLFPTGNIPVFIVEAGRTLGWREITGNPGRIIGMDRFGSSAPYEELAEKFGFTAKAVYDSIKAWLDKAERKLV